MRINLKLFRAHFAVVLLLGASRLLGQTPFISDFTPKYGSPGDTITVYGNNFTAGNKITFYNGQVATTIVLSSGQISATVPSGVSTGPLSITGGSFSSSSFTVVWTGPYITDFSPLAGAVNDTISVNGVHFTGATAVKFGGVNASFSLYSGGKTLMRQFRPAPPTRPSA